MQSQQLQQLFDDLSAALVLYARQWCQSPDDAVQEAFVDLFKTKESPDCPKSWLYTTTRRKAQNIARSEQRRRKHHEYASHDLGAQEPVNNWFLPASSQIVHSEVAQALADLEGDQRELLVARIWGELNFEELATLMGCSVSSAHRRYKSALAVLKQKLTSDDESNRTSSSYEVLASSTGPTLSKQDRNDNRGDYHSRLANGDT